MTMAESNQIDQPPRGTITPEQHEKVQVMSKAYAMLKTVGASSAEVVRRELVMLMGGS